METAEDGSKDRSRLDIGESFVFVCNAENQVQPRLVSMEHMYIFTRRPLSHTLGCRCLRGCVELWVTFCAAPSIRAEARQIQLTWHAADMLV